MNFFILPPCCPLSLPFLVSSEAFNREQRFRCRHERNHLKPNVSRNVGSRRTVISIISQRHTELNYQHGCVQTRAQLITLGRSPCCLCPRSTRSQLTTWRFIASTAQLSTTPELSFSTRRLLTLNTWRDGNNGAPSMYTHTNNAGDSSAASVGVWMLCLFPITV